MPNNVLTINITQLPKKIDEVVFCPLTHEQISVYRRILAHREERIKANGPGIFDDTTLCDCNSGLMWVYLPC